MQEAAFVVVLNVPAAHAAQVRFVVAEPFEVTDSPAEHVVFETHAVVAEPSWSHCSPEHATFAVLPPAQ